MVKRKRSSIPVRSTPSEEEDKFWKSLIHSLEQHTKAELQLFKSENDSSCLHESAASEDNLCLAYTRFLNQSTEQFIKLRRFPKLIAKLLVCFRDYFTGQANFLLFEERNLLELLLPLEFIEMLKTAIASLPNGQIIDLWKTLDHNLKDECLNNIQVLPEKHGLRLFLGVVCELFNVFLMNVKIVDHSIQTSTAEKVKDLMSSLASDCLAKFGSLLLTTEFEPQVMNTFLKLAFAWGEVIGVQFYFNADHYKKDVPTLQDNLDSSPMNLTYLHHYLTTESWLQVESKVNSSGNPNLKVLMGNLVRQKLRFMLALEKRGIDDKVNSLQEHLNTAAKYIWSNKLGTPTEIYTLTSEFLDPSEISEFASNFFTNLQIFDVDVPKQELPSDFQLHYALILEFLIDIFGKLAKIPRFKKFMKKVVNEVFSVENRGYLFRDDPLKKKVCALLLTSVNDLIESDWSDEDDELEFSCDLICHHIRCLHKLNWEDYPSQVRTVMSMCSIVILIPLIRTITPESALTISMASSILHRCVEKSSGNEFLFLIHWSNLFSGVERYLDRIPIDTSGQIILTILQNIYISRQSLDNFESHFDTLCKKFGISEGYSNAGLITLQFLHKEMRSSSSSSKSKVASRIRDHVMKLSESIIKLLEKSSKKGSDTIIYRSCWLLKSVMDDASTQGKSELSESDVLSNKINFESLKKLFAVHIKSALTTLSSANKSEIVSLESQCESGRSRMYVVIFLHTICKSREQFNEILPEDIILRFWESIKLFTSEDWAEYGNMFPRENIHLLPNVLCESATNEEFEQILTSLLPEIDVLNLDSLITGRVYTILNTLVDAKLSAEKKSLRTKFLEDILHYSLQYNLLWNPSVECVDKVILPSLNFQTKILSRKMPICRLPALAICFTSVTSIPLDGISKSDMYRKVFCATTDLLNAFTMHRGDVISFRTHIYLQCFQFLVESLMSRSDQKNKLSDTEVVDLRYCAHAIERICQSTKLVRTEFARIAPYLLAILMRQFEISTVYPAVKDPLMSGSYKLLNLCDKHSISQLNSMLTVGSREIFTRVYELHNKFYRYKGKV